MLVVPPYMLALLVRRFIVGTRVRRDADYGYGKIGQVPCAEMGFVL